LLPALTEDESFTKALPQDCVWDGLNQFAQPRQAHHFQPDQGRHVGDTFAPARSQLAECEVMKGSVLTFYSPAALAEQPFGLIE
jgi:hypothetical protein